MPEVVPLAAETGDEKPECAVQIIVREQVVHHVTEYPDPRIGRLADLAEQFRRDPHAVGNFARIVQMGVARKPNLLIFDDALEAGRVRVMIQGSCNSVARVGRQKMRIGPLIERRHSLFEHRRQRFPVAAVRAHDADRVSLGAPTITS